MPEITINDIPVQFPFEPYEVQKEYMRKVLECLQKGVNGVLESPTGTGKTLSLLCSSLAWLEIKKAQIQANLRLAGNTENNLIRDLSNSSGLTAAENQSAWGSAMKMPQIIYASRTHSQLGQVVAELKRTAYNYVKVAVLGSRDQLCLHPEVSKEPNTGLKVAMCRMKVNSHSCHLYNNYKSKNVAETQMAQQIMDIEDLVEAGRKAQTCPYYSTRDLQKAADIVFVPYNYLLDTRIREIQDIQISNSVIILDEAHNVEKMCEDSASFQLTSTDIALCVSEVTYVMKEVHEQLTTKSFDDPSSTVQKDFTAEDLCILKTMFTELEDAISSIRLDRSAPGMAIDLSPGVAGRAFPASFILDLLSKADITPDKLQILSEMLYNVAQYLTAISESSYQHRGFALRNFLDFIKVVSKSLGPNRDRSTVDQFYRVFVEPEVSKKGWPEKDSWSAKTTVRTVKQSPKTINFWCLSPGQGMRSLLEQGVRCIILTSGTLSPLNATIYELGIPIEVRLENPHIIKDNQVIVSVIGVGPTNNELVSTYRNRSNSVYLKELACTIQNISRVVPDGVLVFFTSYSSMENTVNFWQQEGLWTRMTASKPMFVEPRNKEALNDVLKQYYKYVDDEETKPGAVLLAVCRGKVSEGLDFANGRGRAVVITGLPFPPFKDPRVILKQQYLDKNRTASLQALSGAEWYRLEATRSVNQAVGRVIRHANDYGAILLCDNRFSFPANTKWLSKWLQPHVRVCNRFGEAYAKLVSFFRIAGSSGLLKENSNRPAGASFGYGSGEVREKREGGGGRCSPKKETRLRILNRILECSKVETTVASPKPKNLLAALDQAERMESVSGSSKRMRPPDWEPSCSSAYVEPVAAADDSRSSPLKVVSKTKKKNVLVVGRYYKDFPEPLQTFNDILISHKFEERDMDVTAESARSLLSSCKMSDNDDDDDESLRKKMIAYYFLARQHFDSDLYSFERAFLNYRGNHSLSMLLDGLQYLFPVENAATHILFKSFYWICLPTDKIGFRRFCEENNIK